MDSPSSSSANPSVPRQRSSPANDHLPSPASSGQPQQPYPYPVQHQQQPGWTPSPSAQPFYPQFYQNPQQPYPMHMPPQGQIPGQNPFYDPAANAQFAQWAYHQMMFNAQQGGQPMGGYPQHPSPAGSQRGRTGSTSSHGAHGDYFGGQGPVFTPYPNGAPPGAIQGGPGFTPNQGGPQHQQQYGGFHPYRRPTRQGSQQQEAGQGIGEWRAAGGTPGPPGTFQPPYARTDAASSSSSVNSTGSAHRQRTNSHQGRAGSPSLPPQHQQQNGSSSPAGRATQRTASPPVVTSNAATKAPSGPGTINTSVPSPSSQKPPAAHARTSSTSSATSSASRPSASAVSTPTSLAPATAGPTTRKPSPLSQGSMSVAEKRMSRDDSDLQTMMEPMGSGVRGAGLKGRLRRALGVTAPLKEEDEDMVLPGKGKGPSKMTQSNSAPGGVGGDADDSASNATVQDKKKKNKLFNSRFNRSTDNISISSVSSSASVMIRKLGSLGKIARRNSIAGITSLFKDKKDKEEEEEAGDGKKGKKSKKGKASAAPASVSHVTAELDRSEDWTIDEEGLTPAARLIRQHTLKEEAKKKQEQAAAAAAAAEGKDLPSTWEKNTATRQGEQSPAARQSGSIRVGENGQRVLVEDDDSASEDGDDYSHPGHYNADAWDDDGSWDHGEEDVTVRQDIGQGRDDDEVDESWAVGLRRSVERSRTPAKGILKNAKAYDQHLFLDQRAFNERTNQPARPRSYSETHPEGSQPPQPGPLSHIPDKDPDDIDGLHRHNSQSSAHGNGKHESGASIPRLPHFTFESPDEAEENAEPHGSAPADKASLYNHPNSSAPALSTMHAPTHPPLNHRSATVPPPKKISFASNLSIYDTFSPAVYDRRSEPATWSRLTPALAQRIKEELNSYKMEEMEVHAASRIHTQFFV
ncbi:hypothetical protein PUNSTDRAFT_48315 [Punctularia strigosozonata HHB-11173 SS5]|uniref:uncharacterized protein n=1 Tax=Punctularia strigosozonata (strain HHB-11173) TaxID=741275 RepID=UPI0004416B9D|nr:uncharacterized protein PUNSTDRAFT_48315 [Punctularia strigosozonata HHB-11173 SS5]EIN13282.1 hypothetical protein PUNSTDRAFT_48315 [Punctularia strigosozonata HHB-11173 SS5]